MMMMTGIIRTKVEPLQSSFFNYKQQWNKRIEDENVMIMRPSWRTAFNTVLKIIIHCHGIRDPACIRSFTANSTVDSVYI